MAAYRVGVIVSGNQYPLLLRCDRSTTSKIGETKITVIVLRSESNVIT
jgi:hypothetical protein